MLSDNMTLSDNIILSNNQKTGHQMTACYQTII
jgi:hypothetical protein